MSANQHKIEQLKSLITLQVKVVQDFQVSAGAATLERDRLRAELAKCLWGLSINCIAVLPNGARYVVTSIDLEDQIERGEKPCILGLKVRKDGQPEKRRGYRPGIYLSSDWTIEGEA